MHVGYLASNSDHKPFGYPGVEGQEKRIELKDIVISR